MPDEGAVSCVLAKVDTEAGREVVRAIPPEHVRSAKALVDEALTIVGPNAVVRTRLSRLKTRPPRRKTSGRYRISPLSHPSPPVHPSVPYSNFPAASA